MIIVCQSLLKNTKISGITLFPFILLKNPADRDNRILLTHERIHLRQQAELLILPFYFWYMTEFFIKWIRFRSVQKAYLNISFEKEAYSNDFREDYLAHRKIFSFWKYL